MAAAAVSILDTLQMHSHNDLTLYFADVAELADAQVSEACDGDIVEVQVLSSAPVNNHSQITDIP